MRITCPQCGFFRELPDNKIPVTSTMATCPKCRHRFKFHLDAPAAPVERPSPRPTPSADEEVSSWRRQGSHPARLHRQPPTATTADPEAETEADQQAPGLPEVDEAPVAAAPTPRTAAQEAAPSPPVEPYVAPAPVEEEVYRPARRVAAAPRTSEWVDDEPAQPAPQAPRQETTAVRDTAQDRLHQPVEPEPAPQPRQPASPPPQPHDAGQPAAAPVVPEEPQPYEPPASVQAPREDVSPEPKPVKPTSADGVRDIWARLQAMDEKPGRKHAAPMDDEDTDPEPEHELIADPIPWERQESYGFFPGLFLTLKKILFQPVDFFENMPEGRPKSKALVFNLLISEFLLLIDFLWTLMGLRGNLGPDAQGNTFMVFSGAPSLSFLMALLLVPLVLSVGIYLDAWLTYLLLLLFRSAKKGFTETFRVMCYSAAPTVLSAVPVAGQILSPVILIWYMALQAIGLKKIHGGAYTQTLAAIFIKWSLYLFLLLAMLQSFSPAH